MAEQETQAESRLNVVGRVKVFYQEVMSEMKKVTWPSKEELKTSTSVVMFLLVAMAAVIYVYDALFQVVTFTLFKLAG